MSSMVIPSLAFLFISLAALPTSGEWKFKLALLPPIQMLTNTLPKKFKPLHTLKIYFIPTSLVIGQLKID